MSRLTKGYFIAIVGIAVWSKACVLVDYLISAYNMLALLLAFWRNLLACVALVPTLLYAHRSLLGIHTSQLRFYAFYGLIWLFSIQYGHYRSEAMGSLSPRY